MFTGCECVSFIVQQIGAGYCLDPYSISRTSKVFGYQRTMKKVQVTGHKLLHVINLLLFKQLLKIILWINFKGKSLHEASNMHFLKSC